MSSFAVIPSESATKLIADNKVSFDFPLIELNISKTTFGVNDFGF